MRPRRLDEQLREYYERQRLSDGAQERLKALLHQGQQREPASRWWSSRKPMAAAFLLFVTTAAVWFAVFRGNAPESPHDPTVAIAKYAAAGHNEQQELEFRASGTTDLRHVMKSLDFTPVEPAMMRGMNMRMVGARYTTIEGVLAAQILYVDPKGEPCTLYQMRPVDQLERVSTAEHVVDGLRVNVWREKGLVMVLTRPMA